MSPTASGESGKSASAKLSVSPGMLKRRRAHQGVAFGPEPALQSAFGENGRPVRVGQALQTVRQAIERRSLVTTVVLELESAPRCVNGESGATVKPEVCVFLMRQRIAYVERNVRRRPEPAPRSANGEIGESA